MPSNVGSQFRYEEEITDDKGVYPPFMVPLDAGQVVLENERYTVRDLEIEDFNGNIIWTVTITNLKPSQQTRGHSHAEGSEVYYFQKGRGLIMLKTDTKIVKPGIHVAVPKGVFHKVIASNNEEMIFLTYFNGPLNRPKEKFKPS